MRALFLSLAVACQPVASASNEPSAPLPLPASSIDALLDDAPPPDDCRRDIPDCSAACALRATHHLEFIDWYDRRCAAVILGKNPDKAAGVAPPPVAIEAGTPAAERDELLANPYR